MFEAKIILDSICNGQRLTTMQLTHPRIVHSEFNTHCMFARNASSSRAIPFAVTIKKVEADPFIPVWWGENQSGMQAAKEIADWKKPIAERKWLDALGQMMEAASFMSAKVCPTCSGTGQSDCPDCNGTGEGLNLHKQIVNRILETWSWITVCVTGDAGAWSNYFSLRCHPDAQPEIQKQAYMAQKVYFESIPQQLEAGQWHTPYIKQEEQYEIAKWSASQADRELKFGAIRAVVQVSTGRCARTSYLTQEGTRDFGEDVKLHDRLRYHVPLHASPFEHVCQAMGDNQSYAKYIGWKAYRHMLDREYVTDFTPNHPELIGETV